jgi:adenylate kinase family enzyme
LKIFYQKLQDFPKTVEGLQACEKFGFQPDTLIDLQDEVYDPFFVKFLWRRKVKKLQTKNEESDLEALLQLSNKLRELSLPPRCRRWWHLRVVIIGRRGSRRDTQATLLAQEFGLILGQLKMTTKSLTINEILKISVDVEAIVFQLKDEERCRPDFVAVAVYERLLKQDCLHNGWVLFGYPNTVADLEMLFRMIAPPNRYPDLVRLFDRVRVQQFYDVSSNLVYLNDFQDLKFQNVKQFFAQLYQTH